MSDKHFNHAQRIIASWPKWKRDIRCNPNKNKEKNIMLLAEVNNPSGLRLTKSDTDGIFLHFDAGEKQVGIRLDNPDLVGSSVLITWAEQQFEQRPTAGEWTKEIRDYIADFIYAEQHGVSMQHKPRCLEKDLIEACDRLDKAEATNKDLLEALEKYGRHGVVGGDICEKSKHSDYNCTCGFEAAIAKASPNSIKRDGTTPSPFHRHRFLNAVPRNHNL